MHKIICFIAVNKPRMLQEVSHECCANVLDSIVSYKNDLVFNYMNFNENFINRNKKMEKANG